MTAFVVRNVPPSAVSRTRFQFASGMRAKRPFFRTAALFTRTSTPSRSRSSRSASAAMSSGDVTSAFTASALPPAARIAATAASAPCRVGAVGEDRVEAVGGEPLADGAADAARRARHERDARPGGGARRIHLLSDPRESCSAFARATADSSSKGKSGGGASDLANASIESGSSSAGSRPSRREASSGRSSSGRRPGPTSAKRGARTRPSPERRRPERRSRNLLRKNEGGLFGGLHPAAQHRGVESAPRLPHPRLPLLRNFADASQTALEAPRVHRDLIGSNSAFSAFGRSASTAAATSARSPVRTNCAAAFSVAIARRARSGVSAVSASSTAGRARPMTNAMVPSTSPRREASDRSRSASRRTSSAAHARGSPPRRTRRTSRGCIRATAAGTRPWIRRRASSAASETAKTPTWAGRSSWRSAAPSPKKVSASPDSRPAGDFFE